MIDQAWYLVMLLAPARRSVQSWPVDVVLLSVRKVTSLASALNSFSAQVHSRSRPASAKYLVPHSSRRTSYEKLRMSLTYSRAASTSARVP
jgi:hypothetical protein